MKQRAPSPPLPYYHGTSSAFSAHNSKRKPVSMKRILSKSLLILALLIVFSYFVDRLYVSHVNNIELFKSPLNYMDRECIQAQYYTLLQQRMDQHSDVREELEEDYAVAEKPKICMTTLTDEKKADMWQKLIRIRNFGGLLNVTWDNKVQYCNKHGYYLFDESMKSLDKSRPPSWSKINAAKRLLTEENCTWVLWLDADTIIMNSSIPLESIIPANINNPNNATYDLILSAQSANTWNAGAWFIRNSPWSIKFLDLWYHNMSHFVFPKGLAVSGDNHALNDLLTNGMISKYEYDQHIATPSRCLFNSAALFTKSNLTHSNIDSSVNFKPNSTSHPYYFYKSQQHYHKGDFIAHMIAIDNKMNTAKMLLEDAT